VRNSSKDNTNTKEDKNKEIKIKHLKDAESTTVEKSRKHHFIFANKNKINFDELANTTLFLMAFIGIWQLIYVLGIWPKISLPSPLMVAESFYELLQNNMLITSIAMTLYRLTIGFFISIALGVAIGLAMVKFTGFGKTICCCNEFRVFSNDVNLQWDAQHTDNLYPGSKKHGSQRNSSISVSYDSRCHSSLDNRNQTSMVFCLACTNWG
jgi:hypothetical protein